MGRGRQVYLVYPLVDDSPSQELRNAKRAARVLKETVFKDLRVGLLHGRMKSDEKERAMVAFKDGATDVLVCTTVIEVGIDVPNAGMIVVEHAERFGLSQLHQLRGRVGRGEHKSKCLLVASAKMTDPAVRRLRAIEKTHDGFEIAEEDMRMRGPGEMLGVRQTGIPRFRVGDLLKDGDLMAHARRLADEALEAMSGRDRKALQEAIERCWGPDQDLFPGDHPDPAHEPRPVDRAVVQAPGRQGGDLQKGGVPIQEQIQLLADRHLPLGREAVFRLLRALLSRLPEFLFEVGHQAFHGLVISPVFRRRRVDSAFDHVHESNPIKIRNFYLTGFVF